MNKKMNVERRYLGNRYKYRLLSLNDLLKKVNSTAVSVIDHVPDDDQGLPVGLRVNAQSHQSFGLGTPDSADFIGRDDEPEGVLEVE